MADALTNFGYSTIAVAPSPADTGTTLSVQAGDGAKFPAAPFNCTVWPATGDPFTTNAERVRVTDKGTGDNWTIVRHDEGSTARIILVGDQINVAAGAAFLGAGLVNRKPSYDLKIPDGHCITVAEYYQIGAGVTVTIAADGCLRIA